MSAEPCPPAQESRLLEATPLIRSTFSEASGYGLSLATTSMGPASLPRWCVWVEPATGDPPDRWQKRWLIAAGAALDTWSGHLPVVRVQDQDRAHVQLRRQRPPRRRTASGWRASNGRSRLQLVQVRRQGVWRFEPKVSVLVSPELRAPVLQATALHELGHAFGLWGHSPDPGDAMAVHQGQDPVLKLSARDLETLLWLRQLSTRLGTPEGNQIHDF
jgi:predicted Zn-dependent protease